MHNQMIFNVSVSGNVNCIDITNGETLWHDRIPGRYYASSVIINDDVFFTNLNGKTTRYKASNEKLKGKTSNLYEPIYASFAITQTRLFVRSLNHLWCIKN